MTHADSVFSEKPSGATSLTLYPANGNDTVLAQSCGNSIESLIFHVDENGDGNFHCWATRPTKLCPILKTVLVGVRKFSNLVATVECSNVALDVQEPGKVSSEDCFKEDEAKAAFHSLKSRNIKRVRSLSATPMTDNSQEQTPANPLRLHARQIICTSSSSTELVGDGDPHQNQLHRQISLLLEEGGYRVDSVSARAGLAENLRHVQENKDRKSAFG
ncbi:hypothetical protein SNOG_00457 [Parastagonospora nodorum SN15]|uniref:Uncharacterized protein n=1 Tax=Phaeosphaeria nodorum (strain SN15 / ATCC MYA-4574 / FGSC 10173) TaxID=321614 RepID=Q0V6A7_PHANO|nr:hypothetical protein SNOG_00457 [Parastagonospora nodorum SN15]EAT91952.1 hypothetical protein SNOG_00457 [Parastagonospora nodorum SN15]